MLKIKDFFRNLYIKLPVLTYDILSIPIAWIIAYWVRYNLEVLPEEILANASFPLLVILPLQIVSFYYYKTYRAEWHFSSFIELLNIIKSVTASTVSAILILYMAIMLKDIPRSIFLLYWVGLIALLCSGRAFIRWYREKQHTPKNNRDAKNVIILGAGAAGERLVRDMLREGGKRYKAIGFLDDRPKKKWSDIHGVRVLGAIKQINDLVKAQKVDLIFIAMPSVSGKELRRILSYCEPLDIPIRILPSLHDIAEGQINMNTLREVSIEDLLGREEVELDWGMISTFIKGKRVLITGAGGSIGSELCRQIARLHPGSLCILDNSEYNLYQIGLELREHYSNLSLHDVLACVTNKQAIVDCFKVFKPNIVFHAAAFKHVPLLEDQATAAVRNNVLGTKLVAEVSVAENVDKFILISTDKAVKPTNIMGTSKRIAEIFCQNYNSRVGTKFITVRFGNVLGSRGSVIPLFKKQLEKGLPLTVTHPDITRYFMTIPEACRLILQATVIGEGGEIFVLDMGEPIKIKYLAEQMIRLSGKEPGEDIEIEYIGLRPGEKLYEELFHNLEPMSDTTHKKILRAGYRKVLWDDFMTDIRDIEHYCTVSSDIKSIMTLVKKLVPEYQSPKEAVEKVVN